MKGRSGDVKRTWKFLIVILLVAAVAVAMKQGSRKDVDSAMVATPNADGLPTLVDLGAERCVPCKLMAPILEELEQEYKGKLEVMVIDVGENRAATGRYGVKMIPTQIFYDRDGKEFFRHIGFFSKEEILAKFEEHDIKL